MVILFFYKKHIVPQKVKKVWTRECDCYTYFSHGASNARGVMILIQKGLDIKVIRTNK